MNHVQPGPHHVKGMCFAGSGNGGQLGSLQSDGILITTTARELTINVKAEDEPRERMSDHPSAVERNRFVPAVHPVRFCPGLRLCTGSMTTDD